jgi:TrmH RNA methyltransferase
LWLDGVGNPHNLGAMLRSAAHFGASAVLLPKQSTLALSGAAARVAEGGAEHVRLAAVADPARSFAALRAAGFAVVTTSSHRGEPLYAAALPRRCIFVLGAEVEGVSATVAAAADRRVAIPGTERVESLNVAVAAALLVGEHWRQHRSHAAGRR